VLSFLRCLRIFCNFVNVFTSLGLLRYLLFMFCLCLQLCVPFRLNLRLPRLISGSQQPTKLGTVSLATLSFIGKFALILQNLVLHRLVSSVAWLPIESVFDHYFHIRNNAKRRPGSKLFKNSGVEFLCEAWRLKINNPFNRLGNWSLFLLWNRTMKGLV